MRLALHLALVAIVAIAIHAAFAHLLDRAAVVERMLSPGGDDASWPVSSCSASQSPLPSPSMRAASIALFALLLACGDRAPPAPSTIEPSPDPLLDPSSDPLTPSPIAAARPTVPDDRRCGEPGATPTELPPLLADGRAPIGNAKLKAGDAIAFGTVSLKWDTRVWIGSRGSGHRGDALVLLIDQAEANGGAYGAHEEIVASRERSLHVGPYRFDVKMSDPPIEIDVEVSRNACPETTAIDKAELPLSLWVSTEATRLRTIDSAAAMLQVGVAKYPNSIRLDVSTLQWRQRFDPVPDAPLAMRAGKYVVTIDEVVRPNAARVHVRARVEAAPPIILAVRESSVGCGVPSVAPTTLPPSLAELARVIDEQHVEVDQDTATGAIVLNARRDPSGEYLMLSIAADPPASPSMVSFAGEHSLPQLVRSGMSLLRVDPSGVDEVQVRKLQVACPHELRVSAIEKPTHVWLSTVGHTLVTVGPPPTTPITLELYPAFDSPSISATTPHAYYSTSILPSMVGDAFTLDGFLFEIVDVTSSGGTVFDKQWTTPNTVPAIHVQIAISPV